MGGLGRARVESVVVERIWFEMGGKCENEPHDRFNISFDYL